MANKVLFVDDDRSILNAFERNFSMDRDIVTAEGGVAAVKAIQTQGPFSVIVVDMRMPEMDGIQTISVAREVQPNAVFIMLTGNQDIATAMRAVNEGRVFRYLNKPCETVEITEALDAAQRQHELITAEKELLNGTLVASVNLLTDILELQCGNAIDTNRMAETLAELVSALGLQVSWEERIAARLMLVGMVMLNDQEKRKILSLEPSSAEHQKLVAKACVLSGKMVKKISRLGWVGKVLLSVPEADNWSGLSQREEVAATLLRVVFYWNFLTLKGLSTNESVKEISRTVPSLNSRIVEAMYNLHDNSDAHIVESYPLDQLKEGMVIREDILSEQGTVVVSRGRRISQVMIENLLRTSEFEGMRVKVVVNSCELAGAC